MIYISAREKDKNTVEAIRSTLDQDENIVVSYEGILPGTNYVEQIFDRLKRANEIIFIISKGYEKSDFVNAEISFAFSKAQEKKSKLSLIPVIVGDDFDPPFFIKQYQYIKIDKEITPSQLQILKNASFANTNQSTDSKDNFIKIQYGKKYLNEERKAYEIELAKKRAKSIFLMSLIVSVTLSIVIGLLLVLFLKDQVKLTLISSAITGGVIGVAVSVTSRIIANRFINRDRTK